MLRIGTAAEAEEKVWKDTQRLVTHIQRLASVPVDGILGGIALLRQLRGAGDTAAARAVLREIKLNPRRNEFGYELSLLHLSLSEPDSAIAWVRTFLSQPTSDLFFLRVPFFDPVREDPRFKSLIQDALRR